MDVQTDHQIVAFGENQMMLFDNKTSDLIVTAIRDEDGWLVKAENDNIADVRPESVAGIPPRRNVIQAMVDHALVVLGPSDPNTFGDGYSCTVPHQLEDMP